MGFLVGVVVLSCKEKLPDPPTAAFTIKSNDKGNVVFANTSTNATTFDWDFGDGGKRTTGTGDVEHTYVTTGTYEVKLIAKGEGGTKGASRSVAVDVPQALPVAAFAYAGGDCEAPCEVSFTSLSTHATAWAWDFGDEGTSTLENPKRMYQKSGNYIVKLVVSGPGGTSAPKTETIRIKEKAAAVPTASFTYVVDYGHSCEYPVFFTSTTTHTAGYEWSFGDGETSTEAHPEHSYKATGSYKVVLKVISALGITNEVSTEIVIDKTKLEVNEVFVEGGEFRMGHNDREVWEGPEHSVTVQSFSMATFPVTIEEWRIYAKAKGLVMVTPGYQWNNCNPMVNVSWLDAVAFCNWLSVQSGLKACYTIDDSNVSCDFNATGYRLPTEAEWEYAARGGKYSQGTAFAGSNTVEEVSWYNSNSGQRAHPVRGKKPNELGLYDMSGNVGEWCWDWLALDYYEKSPMQQPKGPVTGEYKVARGGGFTLDAKGSEVTFRGYYLPDFKAGYVGLRVVRTR